jgi:phage shock protein A
VLGTHELGAKGTGGVVTAGPWMARDSYVAETAVLLDRLAAKIERLERREEALNARVADLVEHSQQSGRLQALAESLRNSRDYKLDETIRLMKELRGRIDAIEGPRSDYATLTHRSFVAIDRKFAEIETARSRKLLFAGWQRFAGCLAVACVVGVLATISLRLV